MKYLIFLIFSFVSVLQAREMNMDYSSLSGKAQKEALDEVSQKFNLTLTSSGGGSIDVIRGLDFGGELQGDISLEDARIIVVRIMDIFAARINACKKARPFMIAYPFPEEWLGFEITLTHPTKEHPIAAIYCGRYGISYNKRDGPNPYQDIEIYHETREEARKIVYSEKGRTAVTKEKPLKPKKQKSLFAKLTDKFDYFFPEEEKKGESYTGPPEYRKMFYAFDAYGQEVAKKFDMNFHRSGNPTDVSDYGVRYGLIFFDDHMKSLQEARLFAAGIAKDFRKYIASSDAVKAFVAEYTEMNKQWKNITIPDLEKVPQEICIKIGYWDKDFERPAPPLISEILLVEGYFNYYEKDPQTQALNLVFRESYEDGMKYLASQADKS